jgi:MFS family permease
MSFSPAAGGVARQPSYKWWVVFMLWFVCFFNYADRQAIVAVFPLLASEFHFDEVQLGLVGSAFAWVYAAGAPGAGFFADRFSRKRIILGACVVWSFFTLSTAWCSSLSTFVWVRALTGLGETLYFPAAMALLSDYHDTRTRSRAMAWHQMAVYAGTILGSWLAAALAERHGWHTPFYLFGPVGILMALVLSRTLAEPPRSQVESEPVPKAFTVAETARVLLRNPAALLLMSAFLCANFVAVIFLTWTPSFLVNKFHYSLGSAGLSGTLYIHLASALAVPLAGWLADRLSWRWRSGRVLVQLAGLVFGAAFVAVVGRTQSTVTLVVTMALYGICKGFYDSGIFASLYDTIDPRARGSAAGLMNSVGWAGGALGPLFVGVATKYGRHADKWQNMSDAIAACALVYVAGALLLVAAVWLIQRQEKQRRATN